MREGVKRRPNNGIALFSPELVLRRIKTSFALSPIVFAGAVEDYVDVR
jgi:hypothetical protein